jgi:hypothetical protein
LIQLRLFGGYYNRDQSCPPDTVVAIQMMRGEGFDVAFVDPHEADLLKGTGTS